MRYAVLLGMALLLVGAVFVWFRGASRTEEVLEDELDEVTATRRRLVRVSRTSPAPTSARVRTSR